VYDALIHKGQGLVQLGWQELLSYWFGFGFGFGSKDPVRRFGQNYFGGWVHFGCVNTKTYKNQKYIHIYSSNKIQNTPPY